MCRTTGITSSYNKYSFILAALFTILVELVPPSIRSSAFGVAFFVMENVGGNFPVIVEYLSGLINYRTALTIMYPGELLASNYVT